MVDMDDINKRLEETSLPERIKEKIRDAVEKEGVDDMDDVETIIDAVQWKYEDARIDPLEPVGTVSAQSIGEPGTQMSIPFDEEVIIRRDGYVETPKIGEVVDGVLENDGGSWELDESEVSADIDFEVLSMTKNETVEWKNVEEVSRHETPGELLSINLKSGREIRATKSHSFVTRSNNEVVPIKGEELEKGDYLPIINSVPLEEEKTVVNLREVLSDSDYWSATRLTDGGVDVIGEDQSRNRLKALESGDIREDYMYPRGSGTGLPEELSLDRNSGFLFGAWLAEGSLADYYISLSNVDPEFQQKVRDFAEQYSFSVNEYDNHSGFSESHDIRINGVILSDLIKETCLDNGEKKIPDFALNANKEFVSSLLCGYFSGDGNIGKNSIRASSISRKLLEGVALLLSKFNIHARINGDGLRIPKKYLPIFYENIELLGDKDERLRDISKDVDDEAPDQIDQIPNFGESVQIIASQLGIPSRKFNSATNRQKIGRNRLKRLLSKASQSEKCDSEKTERLEKAVSGDVIWDEIESIEMVKEEADYVYDFSVSGLDTFTTAQGVVTHNTMNTFHYAGVAEIDVTQGLPRLIEIVDARKEPDTPMMTVYLEDEWSDDRDKARDVVYNIEATTILSLGDISIDVAEMKVSVEFDDEELEKRSIDVEEIAEKTEDELGVEVEGDDDEGLISFSPETTSYRELLQLVEELREIVYKGIDGIDRVVVRKEEVDGDEEYVLYTEGSKFKKTLKVEGVDATRAKTNNLHEMDAALGIEAARNSIISETLSTLQEQGLEVDIRHVMLVADAMTTTGEIQSIGRHGISGSKGSVLSRAAFEVTVNHLLDAAVHGEIDDLSGVTENVIVGQPIKLGTGDVNLVMKKPE